MILQTDRLILREMTQADFPALCKILQDKDVMYAYEHAFETAEAQMWLDNQVRRYAEFGFGLWAVVLEETGEMIGQCGLSMQDFDDRQVLEVGYLFQKAFWGLGYATEAAIACRNYAFEQLDTDEVFSIIRDNNEPSAKVAIRGGMNIVGSITKHYYNVLMPHNVYSIKRKS